MINTRWVETIEAFDAIKQEWNSLFELSGSNNPFSSYDWAYLWWKYFAESSWGLSILLVYKSEKLIGIAPLFSSSCLGGKKYQLLGTGRSDFPDVTVLPEEEKRFFDEFANQMLKKLGLTDVLDLHEVLRTKRLEPLSEAFALKGFYRLERHKDIAPYISLDGLSWDEYLQSKGNKKFRKPMLKKEKRLLAKGDVTVEKYSDLDVSIFPYNNAFELASDIECRSWKFTNGSERINTDERSKAWFKELMQRFSSNKWLDFWVYTYESEVKAYAVNFNVNGRISAYNSAYCEESAELGPGALMHIYRIRNAFDEGIHTYSFLRGCEAYKFDWTDKQENLHQVIFSRSRWFPYALTQQVRWFLAEIDWVKKLREKALNLRHKLKRS